MLGNDALWWIGLFVMLVGFSPLAVLWVGMMVSDIGWKGSALVFGVIACLFAGPFLMRVAVTTELPPSKSIRQTTAESKRDSGRVETQSATCTCDSREE